MALLMRLSVETVYYAWMSFMTSALLTNKL